MKIYRMLIELFKYKQAVIDITPRLLEINDSVFIHTSFLETFMYYYNEDQSYFLTIEDMNVLSAGFIETLEFKLDRSGIFIKDIKKDEILEITKYLNNNLMLDINYTYNLLNPLGNFRFYDKFKPFRFEDIKNNHQFLVSCWRVV